MRYFVDTRNNKVITQDMINAFAAPETYYEYGSFDFVKKEYQYPYEASPLNISSNNCKFIPSSFL